MHQPNSKNKHFHALTRAKAKMYEYDVPLQEHINIQGAVLTDMLDLTIAILGDIASSEEQSDIEDKKSNLLFSAQYFNSLLETKIISEDDILLRLLSSSAYYLSDYPGSSDVIIKDLSVEHMRDATLMEQLLFSVLKRKALFYKPAEGYPYQTIKKLINEWNIFLSGGSTFKELDDKTKELKLEIYSFGTDKDLLLIDIVRMTIFKRFKASAKNILFTYSDVAAELWEPYFSRSNHIKEFWPAQIKLAEQGLFKGTSAVIQMPTSAGKTRAAEFIVRSSFLSGRSTLAVIVAPFKALCQEIHADFIKNFLPDTDVKIDLISDALIPDFEFGDQETSKTIMILTPEKLDFMIRHDPSFSMTIDLIIYDEGHLFDDKSRGPKYELLLSSLKQQLPFYAQIVLISAVMTNCQEVKDWLIQEDGVLIDGKNLNPTNRSIGFVDWNRFNRFIRFVDEKSVNDDLFFVPTVLESHKLEPKINERGNKFFPKPDKKGLYKANEIAGFLGVRLSSAGLCAIFTGQKKSVPTIVRGLINAFDRNLPVQKPIVFSSNIDEANRVVMYIEKVLGKDSENVHAAKLGILMHHVGIPHGIRLITEDALQKSFFKLVVCTSTLSQGVNLPIRYLIISSSHQSKEKIKTRDFHNLMGRAGRSNEYTEGTVIFANPDIYRDKHFQKRNWTETTRLLNINNYEPTKSRIHSLFTDKPENQEDIVEWENNITLIKGEITSYLLMALGNIQDEEEMQETVAKLAKNTLAYCQLDQEDKSKRLLDVFSEIGQAILTTLPKKSERIYYAKSILNLEQSHDFIQKIKENIVQTIDDLSTGKTETPLDLFWDYLFNYSKNKTLKSFENKNDVLTLCKQWIRGDSFSSMLVSASAFKRNSGTKFSMINMVDLCENGFGYDISTLLNSLYELSTLVFPEEYQELIKPECDKMQKRLKYGTPGSLESLIYELGFSDRTLSIEIAEILGNPDTFFRHEIKQMIVKTPLVHELISEQYPTYFTTRLWELFRF